jgi:hypothetical protein
MRPGCPSNSGGSSAYMCRKPPGIRAANRQPTRDLANDRTSCPRAGFVTPRVTSRRVVVRLNVVLVLEASLLVRACGDHLRIPIRGHQKRRVRRLQPDHTDLLVRRCRKLRPLRQGTCQVAHGLCSARRLRRDRARRRLNRPQSHARRTPRPRRYPAPAPSKHQRQNQQSPSLRMCLPSSNSTSGERRLLRAWAYFSGRSGGLR